MTHEKTAPTVFPALPAGPAIQSVAVFCGDCSCGCPALFLDHGAEPDRHVMLTDDFGQRVQMSMAQLSVLVAGVKGGVLDHLVAQGDPGR